jgi:serine/threonine-protein kinase
LEDTVTTNLQPGDMLRDRYQIIGLLGVGGMGTVYLADDNRLEGRQCAVKEIQLQPSLSDDVGQRVRTQFRNEASTLARLDHPGLPKVSDFFSIDARDYLVMDFVPGQNLLEITTAASRNGGFLDELTVLNWLNQLCDTLIYLHSRQPAVLHRDIKPANIKLTPDGRLKLVDFGLVKPLDPNDPSTLTGLQGAGSLPYAPLEQYVDHLGHTDARSDLYALGATAFHLFTGMVPASAQERFIVPESLPDLQAINPAVSPELAVAVLAAMAPHPKDRPASVAVWKQMLNSLALTQPMPAADISAASAGLVAGLRGNWWLVGAAIIMLAASLALTFGVG